MKHYYLFLLLSWPAVAQIPDSDCQMMAQRVVHALQVNLDTNIGLSQAQREREQSKLKQLTDLLAQARYCEALQLATLPYPTEANSVRF